MKMTKAIQKLITCLLLLNISHQLGSTEENVEEQDYPKETIQDPKEQKKESFCKSINDFNRTYKKELNEKNILDLFKANDKVQGSGSFGSVKKIGFKWTRLILGQEKKEEEYVSVKIQFPADKEEINLIRTEISYLKYFSNYKKYGSLFKYIDCVQSKNFYLIITEALKKNLNKGREFFKKITKIQRYQHYLKLLKDLSYFHEEDIVHLDIKPDNILSTNIMNKENNFELKMIDYGLMEESTKNSSNGTPYFLPPSVWRRDEENHKARDIYALLLSIFVIEFGDAFYKFAEKNDLCFKHTSNPTVKKGFTPECFNKLLEMIYVTYLDNENNYTFLKETRREGYGDFMENVYNYVIANPDVNNISSFLLKNIHYNNYEYKGISLVISDFEKVIENEKIREKDRNKNKNVSCMPKFII